jgi:hypothetical protein
VRAAAASVRSKDATIVLDDKTDPKSEISMKKVLDLMAEQMSPADVASIKWTVSPSQISASEVEFTLDAGTLQPLRLPEEKVLNLSGQKIRLSRHTVADTYQGQLVPAGASTDNFQREWMQAERKVDPHHGFVFTSFQQYRIWSIHHGVKKEEDIQKNWQNCQDYQERIPEYNFDDSAFIAMKDCESHNYFDHVIQGLRQKHTHNVKEERYVVDEGDYVYNGQFKDGARQGFGTLSIKLKLDTGRGNVTGLYPVYRGLWSNDMPAYAYVGERCSYSYCGNCIYFGPYNEKGQRSGQGVLYHLDAWKDDDFQQCFRESRKFEPQRAQIPHAGMLKVEWKGDDKNRAFPALEWKNGGDLKSAVFKQKDEDLYKIYEGLFFCGLPHDETGRATEWTFLGRGRNGKTAFRWLDIKFWQGVVGVS